jgi:organic radical activating enzyme
MKEDINVVFSKTKKQLDVISPTMCAAKWLQVTLHLGNGTNHSCHHPKVHSIPLDELKDNPSALHNTNYKKQMRRQMLNGERPSECDYCWRVEDEAHNEKNAAVFSDRIVKSSENWAGSERILQLGGDGKSIKPMPWDADVVPTYLEVDFDTTCNFKCAYCSPLYSTTWMQEIKKHGPYDLTFSKFNGVDNLENEGLPILQSEYNPYIEAFWKWFPNIVNKLETFRITGGEPLLSKNTFKVIDFLIENPQPNLDFSINTNLGSPDEVINKFIKKAVELQEKKCVEQLKIFTSNEAHGKRAEYTRFGLDYQRWHKNVDRILSEIPDSKVTMMCTYNALSVTSFLPFLEDMLDFKLKYAHRVERQLPLAVDVPYLRHPHFLASWILTEDFIPYIEEQVTFMYKNMERGDWFPLATRGFFEHEVHRMRRTYQLIKNKIGKNKKEHYAPRTDFAKFIDEYDVRRGTNFIETFPEMEGFYYFCRDHKIEDYE